VLGKLFTLHFKVVDLPDPILQIFVFLSYHCLVVGGRKTNDADLGILIHTHAHHRIIASKRGLLHHVLVNPFDLLLLFLGLFKHLKHLAAVTNGSLSQLLDTCSSEIEGLA